MLYEGRFGYCAAWLLVAVWFSSRCSPCVLVGELKVNAVVSGGASDHQTNGWDEQTRRLVGVSMADFDHDQVIPFQIDDISSELVGEDQTVRYLAGIAGVPEIRDELRRGLLAHDLHNIGDIGRCNCSGIGKTIHNGSDAKAMIAVTVVTEIVVRFFITVAGDWL